MDLRLFDEKQAQRQQQRVFKDEVVIAGIGPVKVPVQSSLKKEDDAFRVSEAFDKVDQPYGSGAGAGSDFFHMYKKEREREIDRIQAMDKNWETKVANEKLQETRITRMEMAEAKTAKKREKRKRQQENSKEAKKLGKIENKFASDGSFFKEQRESEAQQKEIREAREKERAEERLRRISEGVYIPQIQPAVQEPSKTADQMKSMANITVREVD